MRLCVMIFTGIFATFCAYADVPSYLDQQLNELTLKRDSLKKELEACEKNTRGYKIAGISTLAATGVGVWGNIALAQEIKKLKQNQAGGGYGGGSNSGISADDCAKDPVCAWERECADPNYMPDWDAYVAEKEATDPMCVEASRADPACGCLCCAAHTTPCKPGC